MEASGATAAAKSRGSEGVAQSPSVAPVVVGGLALALEHPAKPREHFHSSQKHAPELATRQRPLFPRGRP